MINSSKIYGADEILKEIRSGDKLVFSYVHSGYNQLLEAFAEKLPEKVDLFIPFLRFRKEDLPKIDILCEKSKIRILTPLPIPEFSKFITEGKLIVLNLTWSQIPNFIANKIAVGRVWIFCEVAPPENNSCNTGHTAFFPLNLYKECIVVGIINQNMPRTFGDTRIPIEFFDYFIEIPQPKLPLYSEIEFTETTKKVAEYVSELIEDGSTIQLGVGDIAPILVKYYLVEKENLKIHTGMFNQFFKELIEKNVIKEVCRAHIAFPYTIDFYNWLNHNSMVEMKTIDYIYNTSIMANIPRFVAINSALYVDLQGQVVVTTINSRIISGIGGLLDFARGSKMSKLGKSIIALESTFKKTGESRIKPSIMPGDTVSLTCYDVDYIVSEYGVAKISGSSRREIALRLIEIASPDHRKSLYEEARKLNLI